MQGVRMEPICRSVPPVICSIFSPLSIAVRSFQRLFPVLEAKALYAWDRLRLLCRRDTKDTIFLRSLLKTETIDWAQHQSKLASLLAVSRSYTVQGHLLTAVLRRCNREQLKEIVESAVETMFGNSDFNFTKLRRFFNPKEFTDVMQSNPSVCDIDELAACLPREASSKPDKTAWGIMKTLRVVYRYFPNFMDTCLKAFNLIEAGKGPESIWDFAALTGMYFKIFLLPYTIFTVLSVFVSAPLWLFVATAAVFAAGLLGVCLYIKCRPCPTSLPRARNLTEEAASGRLDPVVGRDQEVQEIVAYLGKNASGILTNLILVGEPGVGKTEIVKGVAQQCREKRIFALNAPELASGFSCVGDKLRFILLDIKGHENKVILFIDELGDAMKKNPTANLAGYLKPLLSQDGVQVIAAVTQEEYKELIASDLSLRDRFHKIEVKPTTKHQTTLILQERIDNKGEMVRIAPGVPKVAYSLTKTLLQPRQSVKLLDLAINRICAFDVSNYVSNSLREARVELARKQRQYQIKLQTRGSDHAETAQDIKELHRRIAELEARDRGFIDLALKLRRLIGVQHRLQQKHCRLARERSKDHELVLLHTILLPKLESMVQEKLQQLPDDIPMEVNESMLKRICAESRVH